MTQYTLILLFTATFFLHAQVSNVRQITENGRIVINYDLQGQTNVIYDVVVTARDAQGNTIKPNAVAGNIEVTPGYKCTIWWEPQLEGCAVIGWTITLTPTINYSKKLNIKWILVKGGPSGDYYISATEVTFDQFDAFCIETGYRKPKEYFGRGRQPVINVSVTDAQAFCKWLSEKTKKTIRLPEESEWEFAANGGSKSRGYKYSGSNNLDEVGWYNENSESRTHEVATKKANELYIYDMSGDAWEWCGINGAIRGGAWYHLGLFDPCRISGRDIFNPDSRMTYIGFRLLQEK